jgi:hypothetical protein
VFGRTPFLPVELLRIAITTALYFGSIWGWGSLICARLSKKNEHLTDFIAARVVMGCLSLYFVFILLALFRELHQTGVLAVLAAGLVSAFVYGREVLARLRGKWSQALQASVGDRLLLSLVLVLAFLQIAFAFTPLTFYDSQVYQLLAPVQFLKAGHLVHIPWNFFTNSPLAIQLTLGMSWALDTTGGAFKLLLALLGLLAILSAARIGREVGIGAAIVSGLCVAAYPEFWMYQTLGIVDFGIAAFVVFGAVWWTDSIRESDWKRAVLSGAAFGFAVASRYQGALLVVWMMVGIIVVEFARNRKTIRDSVAKAALVCGIMTLMTLPWLVRNYRTFQNPVYPLMYDVLGGAEWSAGQSAAVQDFAMGPGFGSVPPVQKLLAPISSLLIFPGNGLFSLALLMGALMAAYWRRFKDLRTYAVLGIGGLILWGILHPTPRVELLRFNSATLILLLACTGALLAQREVQYSGVRVALTLALGSVVIALVSVNNIVPVWQTLASGAQRVEAWRASVPSWQALDFANDKLDPAHDKLLLIGDARAVWLKIPFIAPSGFNGPQLTELLVPGADSEERMRRLRRLGITHILVCSSEWQRLADATGYFRLPDDQLKPFLAWLHTLPVVFDDHRGNAILSLVRTAT